MVPIFSSIFLFIKIIPISFSWLVKFSNNYMETLFRILSLYGGEKLFLKKKVKIEMPVQDIFLFEKLSTNEI